MILLAATILIATQTPNDPANHCANPRNGGDVSECTSMLLAAEERRMAEYVLAAKTTLDGRTSSSGEDLSDALILSQIRWQADTDAVCELVDEAGNYSSENCRSALTQERTHFIWEYFLTAGAPILEEPEPLMVGAGE